MSVDWRALFIPETSFPKRHSRNVIPETSFPKRHSRNVIPETSLLELVIRGSVMYLLLLAALRVLVRRHIGSLSLMDLLLMVLIADAAQNAMASEYRSITEGIVLCGTLIGWNYFLDWLAYRSRIVQRMLEPPPCRSSVTA